MLCLKQLKTALHFAIDRKGPNIIRYLVKNGADIFSQDSIGDTPLFLAVVSLNNIELVKYLLEQGTLAGDSNFVEWGLVFKAVLNNNLDTLNSFLNRGININVQIPYVGETPLHYAIYKDNLKIAEWFIDHNCCLVSYL